MTHDKISMRSKAVASLQEVENEVVQYAVVAIDEAQFLPGKITVWQQSVTSITAALSCTGHVGERAVDPKCRKTNKLCNT